MKEIEKIILQDRQIYEGEWVNNLKKGMEIKIFEGNKYEG